MTTLETRGHSISIHFMALYSKKKDAVPVVMSHGWPGKSHQELKRFHSLISSALPLLTRQPYTIRIYPSPSHISSRDVVHLPRLNPRVYRPVQTLDGNIHPRNPSYPPHRTFHARFRLFGPSSPARWFRKPRCCDPV
jgi:hypothetical protein